MIRIRPDVRQDRILRAIAAHWAKHGYAPTMRHLASVTGVATSTVKRDLDDLREAGEVKFEERRPGTLRLAEHAETTRT